MNSLGNELLCIEEHSRTIQFVVKNANNLLNDFCGLRQECSRGHFPEKMWQVDATLWSFLCFLAKDL